MRRNIALISLLILGNGPSAFLQQPVASPSNSEGSPGQQRPGQQPAHPQPENPNEKTLTNDDVVRMVTNKLPESIIIASIQSSSNKFDFSSGALIGLLRKGVSQKIIDAMKAASSGVEGESRAVEKAAMSPSPVGPTKHYTEPNASGAGGAAHVSAQFIALSKNLKFTKTGEIKNPAVQASPTLTTLKMQRQAAEIEPGQVQSSSGNPAGSNPIGTTASTSPMRGAAAVAGKTGPPAGPSHPGGPSGAMASAAGLNVCLDRTTIATVNKAKTGVIFTPEGDYNLYTITGCGFGSTPGKIYLQASGGGFPAHKGRVNLIPAGATSLKEVSMSTKSAPSWSERSIVAQVDPTVSGELDQGSISLVIETASGGRAQADGFSFLARRSGPIPLSSIPPTSVTASPLNANGLGVLGTWLSPCGNWGLKDCTAEALSETPFVIPGRYAVHHYTIKLKSGFELWSVEMEIPTELDTSPTTPTNNFRPKFNGYQVDVVAPILKDPATGFTYSLYGIKFWVKGPVGIANPLADGQ